jgi:hypothetical protein
LLIPSRSCHQVGTGIIKEKPGILPAAAMGSIMVGLFFIIFPQAFANCSCPN